MIDTQSVNNKNSDALNFDTLASEISLKKTAKALEKNNFTPHIVKTKTEALEKIKSLIPENVSIMNGSSMTLQEIGFVEYLKSGEHPWDNLHDVILAEKDNKKQTELRRKSVVSDYYTGSAHAVTEEGEILIASNTGSQLSHLVYTSPNIILVIGTQKIVPGLSDAFKRLEEHVIPLEDKRMMDAYGMGTTHSKTLILHKENPMMGRKINVVLVKQYLGF